MNRVANQTSKGFTIIELMLAMAFIGVLLLTIAMTVIQIGTIYNKGLSVKELNQSSRSIAADVARTASEAKLLNLSNDYRVTSAGGRLCFGSYSYIWNTVPVLDANSDENITRYEGATGRKVQFVKVPDAEKSYCMRNADGRLSYRDIRGVDVPQARELLPGGDYRMGVYRIDIPAAMTVTDPSLNQSLYTFTFTIGSGNKEAMNPTQTACLPPDQANSNLVYCNVQDFSIVLRTGNEG